MRKDPTHYKKPGQRPGRRGESRTAAGRHRPYTTSPGRAGGAAAAGRGRAASRTWGRPPTSHPRPGRGPFPAWHTTACALGEATQQRPRRCTGTVPGWRPGMRRLGRSSHQGRCRCGGGGARGRRRDRGHPERRLRGGRWKVRGAERAGGRGRGAAGRAGRYRGIAGRGLREPKGGRDHVRVPAQGRLRVGGHRGTRWSCTPRHRAPAGR